VAKRKPAPPCAKAFRACARQGSQFRPDSPWPLERQYSQLEAEVDRWFRPAGEPTLDRGARRLDPHACKIAASTRCSVWRPADSGPTAGPGPLFADSRAHVTAAQTDAMPMQRFAASSCRGPALTRPDLGRLHSSATGVAEPDPDASYVALAIVRCRAGARSKQSCAAAHTDARYWAIGGARDKRCRRSPSRISGSEALAVMAAPFGLRSCATGDGGGFRFDLARRLLSDGISVVELAHKSLDGGFRYRARSRTERGSSIELSSVGGGMVERGRRRPLSAVAACLLAATCKR
jgi:hypothetical protein